MYKLINNSSRLPKFVKILLDILLTLSCVYLIGLCVYKILEAIRKFLHWTTEKRNWWTFLMCIVILAIGTFIVAQFILDLDPFGNLVRWFNGLWLNFLKTIGTS